MAATLLFAALLVAPPSDAAATAVATIGAPAPDFTLTGTDGKAVTLSSLKGKTVVLEWNNPECPFVKKHYGAKNMQKTQADAVAKGAVWLSINSNAPGTQGSFSVEETLAWQKQDAWAGSSYLMDPDGKVGQLYAAKTTPHMYVIDAKGNLVYMGGIDDKRTPDPADIATARNHVKAAVDELAAGKPVSVPTSRPYGCAIKYRKASD